MHKPLNLQISHFQCLICVVMCNSARHKSIHKSIRRTLNKLHVNRCWRDSDFDWPLASRVEPDDSN